MRIRQARPAGRGGCSGPCRRTIGRWDRRPSLARRGRRPPPNPRPTTRPRRRPRRGAPGIVQLPWRRLVNPFRPLEVLTADQVEAIHRASLRILAEIGVEVLGDRALDAFAARRRDGRPGDPAGPARPGAGRGARRPGAARRSSCTPATRSANIVFGGTNLVFGAVGGPAFVQRPRSRPAGRQLRRLRRLRPADRRPRRHPPGGRRPARADRPAGRDPPPRHVPDVRGRARQDLAVPRLRGDAGRRRARGRLR